MDLASAVRNALDCEDEDVRSERFIEATGWASGQGEAILRPTSGKARSLHLGGYPTSAGIIQATSRAPVSRIAWHFGLRFGVAPLHNELLYVGLDHRRQWRARSADLNADVLRGFTPEGFARLGRFEPGTDQGLEPLEFPLPNEAASVFISQWLAEQLADYLKQYAIPESDAEAKREFVHFAAALLLLRTIEDLGCLSWLLPGTLREAASDMDRLDALMERAAEKLNSRVLGKSDVHLFGRPGRKVLQASAFVTRMVSSAYSGEMGAVDFAALEVDPVGHFFERLLGRSYERVNSQQPGLFERGGTIRTDASEQRRTGSYYTPRIYADTMARRLVRPELRRARSVDELPIILDLAAGSGELLCAALREVLSQARWRTVDAVREVLEHRIFAVDKQATALQLCALNLLRTAIRAVPELLTDPRKLPRLTGNFIVGDALSQAVADQVPEADVTLINPPFAPDRHWRPLLEDPVKAVTEVGRPGNLAMAFLATAVQKTRPEGFIGAVLPSNQFGTDQGQPWRIWITERLAIDTVIANHAEPFKGAKSRAGIIMGRKLLSEQTGRPRVRYLTIDGRKPSDDFDGGALLGAHGGPHVTEGLEAPLLPTQKKWAPQRKPTIGHPPSTQLVPLRDLVASRPHQGVVPAPKPWNRALFLFDVLGGGYFRHRFSGEKVLANDSPALRPVSWPILLDDRRRSVWCEPCVSDMTIFYPGDEDVSLDVLRESDPGGFRVAELIMRCIAEAKVEGEEGRKYRNQSAGKCPNLLWKRGYYTSTEPMVFTSQSISASLSRPEVAVSSWVSEERRFTPISGIYFRMPNIESAFAIAAWLSLHEQVEALRATGSERHQGDYYLRVKDLEAWKVPDLRLEQFAPRLGELAGLMHEYRKSAAEMASEQARCIPTFAEIQALARSFWK